MHALCKLPREDLQQKTSKLTSNVLRKHRERWRSAAALFLDEISMVAPEQLHQTDVRVQQATQKSQRLFGGLCTVLSGDFLQLPPVERGSLARRPTATVTHHGEDPDTAVPTEPAEATKPGEADQGFLRWHGLTRVVSLSVNIRAPGLLGRLQSEMRAGSISDDMWRLYQSRVLQRNDPRLLAPPFSTNEVQYIVHRHRIRARQAFRNAVEHCQQTKQRLYVVKACVEAPVGEEHLLSAQTMEELLSLTGLKPSGGVPSILPLYIGMRLLLNSKDCVRFGLMKGCECTLEQIIFADAEVLPHAAVAGDPIELEFLPQSLLLRAKGAQWKLPPSKLPPLSPTVDRRGLFQLEATPVYLRRQVGAKEYKSFKRTGFLVVPADTRIVYAAQGETFDAVVADMERPPRMDLDTHWLACYVMISRARTLEGFLVLRPALLKELSREPPKYLTPALGTTTRQSNPARRRPRRFKRCARGPNGPPGRHRTIDAGRHFSRRATNEPWRVHCHDCHGIPTQP